MRTVGTGEDHWDFRMAQVNVRIGDQVESPGM